MKRSLRLQRIALAFLILPALSAFCSVTSAAAAEAREVVYVDNKAGSDDFNGQAAVPGPDKAGPFATIMQAVRKCGVGARIEIANTGIDYRESVKIDGFKKGRPDTPLSIDGHGAYVTGLVAVRTEQWVRYKDDIYYFVNKGEAGAGAGKSVFQLMPKSNWLLFLKHQGWFTEKEAPEIFLLNGKPGPNALSLDALAPGGFFYDTQGATLGEGGEKRCLFFRLPDKGKLQDCKVELPLNDGIHVSDDYVTVANIGSRYSRDDGFSGFWGQGVVLKNIHAAFNCDQGVSFHGNSTTLIDGGLIERNGGCGIVDVMSCTTTYRNVTVRNNFPKGVLLQGFAHAMFNCRIVGNATGQVSVGKRSSGFLNHCLIVGNGSKTGGAAVSLGYGRINQCTIVNSQTGVAIEGSATVGNSIVANCQTPLTVAKGEAANVSITKTLMAPGDIIVEGQRLDAAGLKAAFPEVILDAPALEEPSFALPKDSPYLKAGENGKALGAALPLFKEWTGQD